MINFCDLGNLSFTLCLSGREIFEKLFEVALVVAYGVSADITFVAQVFEKLGDQLLHDREFIHRLRRFRRFLKT